jgi:hypothetical protein
VSQQPLLCACCGRVLTNDPKAPNAARWTLYDPRLPYCADSPTCKADTEPRLTLPWGWYEVPPWLG